jgi:uncharacterized protein
MKYLILVLVVAAALWWARSRRSTVARKPPAAPPALQAMVPCAHCGVHLPRSEALSGALGLYCSEEHRRARGDRPA